MPPPNVPRRFFHQPHVPKFSPRGTLRFFLLLPSLRALSRRHLQMALHFLFEFRFPPLPPPKIHRPPLRFFTSLLLRFLISLCPYSSGCSTPAIASESCDHFERSLVSCFFPAAVS